VKLRTENPRTGGSKTSVPFHKSKGSEGFIFEIKGVGGKSKGSEGFIFSHLVNFKSLRPL